MKQEIHTIPIVEAFESGDECPFCYLQRQTEQRAIRFFIGPSASYMEPGVRAITNKTGFCPQHTQALYDYGNPLGSALMMQTRYEQLLQLMQPQMQSQDKPQKTGLFQKKKSGSPTPLWQQLQQHTSRCAICEQVEENMQRHYQVFFSLLKEEQFRQIAEHSKGFCIPHFTALLAEAEQHLRKADAAWFYSTVYTAMEENLKRVKGDLDWLIAKYDYRNSSAPWGNAQDALQRAMQKISGIYPADEPYRKD